MTSFLYSRRVRISDYARFAEPQYDCRSLFDYPIQHRSSHGCNTLNSSHKMRIHNLLETRNYENVSETVKGVTRESENEVRS